MRAFVTGGHGFVGGWLRGHLEESGDAALAPGEQLDVTDLPSVCEAVESFRPDAIYHLAALTQVGESWNAPGEFLRVNAMGTLNVLEAARRCSPMPRVLVVSSAEAYGLVAGEELPLREESRLRPVSPYAASKVASEFLGLQSFLGNGVPTFIARPFNHVGPGQAPSFVVSAIARRIADAERADVKTVKVGNLAPRRDFTDVRDVVRAYRMLMEAGEPGEIYNICSGTDVSVSEVAETLRNLAKLDVSFEPDPSLVRPVDIPVLVGDSTRLREATGWSPEIPLERTLSDVLDYWRERGHG